MKICIAILTLSLPKGKDLLLASSNHRMPRSMPRSFAIGIFFLSLHC